MVLDSIPQSLPVHFFGPRPQPPTSHPHRQFNLRQSSIHDTHTRTHAHTHAHIHTHVYTQTHVLHTHSAPYQFCSCPKEYHTSLTSVSNVQGQAKHAHYRWRTHCIERYQHWLVSFAKNPIKIGHFFNKSFAIYVKQRRRRILQGETTPYQKNSTKTWLFSHQKKQPFLDRSVSFGGEGGAFRMEWSL